MHHLLPVSGVVALVRVIADESVLMAHQEGFPDRREAVVGHGTAARGNVRDEPPRRPAVCRGIEINLRAGEVRRNGAARE